MGRWALSRTGPARCAENVLTLGDATMTPGDMRTHDAQCAAHLARLRMLAGDEASTAVPHVLTQQVTQITGMILTEAEAAGHAVAASMAEVPVPLRPTGSWRPGWPAWPSRRRTRLRRPSAGCRRTATAAAQVRHAHLGHVGGADRAAPEATSVTPAAASATRVPAQQR